jgi:hypothetical protein
MRCKKEKGKVRTRSKLDSLHIQSIKAAKAIREKVDRDFSRLVWRCIFRADLNTIESSIWKNSSGRDLPRSSRSPDLKVTVNPRELAEEVLHALEKSRKKRHEKNRRKVEN